MFQVKVYKNQYDSKTALNELNVILKVRVKSEFMNITKTTFNRK